MLKRAQGDSHMNKEKGNVNAVSSGVLRMLRAAYEVTAALTEGLAAGMFLGADDDKDGKKPSTKS